MCGACLWCVYVNDREKILTQFLFSNTMNRITSNMMSFIFECVESSSHLPKQICTYFLYLEVKTTGGEMYTNLKVMVGLVVNSVVRERGGCEL